MLLSSIILCFLIFNQLRTVHCMVRIKNATKTLDNILCEDAGLKAPETIEKCGNIECPKWVATDWSPCQKSKCFARHTALQKRDVSCSAGKETVIDKCDESEKPTTKQECYNELCKGDDEFNVVLKGSFLTFGCFSLPLKVSGVLSSGQR